MPPCRGRFQICPCKNHSRTGGVSQAVDLLSSEAKRELKEFLSKQMHKEGKEIIDIIAEFKARENFIEILNSRQVEYARYKFPLDKGEKLPGTLLWEFSKIVVEYLKTPMDARALIEINIIAGVTLGGINAAWNEVKKTLE
jgi:hypothetical protein